MLKCDLFISILATMVHSRYQTASSAYKKGERVDIKTELVEKFLWKKFGFPVKPQPTPPNEKTVYLGPL